ncbi:hypothetical protein WL88_16305 [Burkholderia diffusa]|uniref:Luciferase-like domain-containing protein n=1 Tax=Burkholderia diffusa TaxID=488732 RepID=A0AAW3PDR6_9BURK|nr:hypothetical protein WI28_23225 [Burkholderia diffusa]KVC17486.1 hypothetical protein WI69_14270 [Burkholderia diffusa]KWF31792.1 hypothetical protein WL85_19265 [Burkholderia diffusa]KWF35157.1 hypothetical protein WL86_25455 [Burkholderia diffusa]KWF48641.1 hypothetical protein WL87_01460 [Burkholderia diffusa]
MFKRIGFADAPVDHDGAFSRLRVASPFVKGAQRPHVPIHAGGSSQAAAALAVAGQHADACMTWGEPPAAMRDWIARVWAAAMPFGHTPRIGLSFRPIVADTEAGAQESAGRVRACARARGADRVRTPATPADSSPRAR